MKNFYSILLMFMIALPAWCATNSNVIGATQNYTVNGVSFKMVKVDGGTFTMGATNEQGNDAMANEKPTHSVTISGFAIGETEVTQELWQAVMGYNPSRYTGNAQCPVENVSWDDCQAFIYKLNQLTGKNFRLPSEAEWEFAARGGNSSNGYKFSGSNDISSVGWYSENSGKTTHPVKSLAANELGIYDMSGNVSEWCQDGWASYSEDPVTNPWNRMELGYGKMIRGGNSLSNSDYCRNSYRGNNYVETHSSIYGLRLLISDLDGQNVSFVKEEESVTVFTASCSVPIALKRGVASGSFTAEINITDASVNNMTLQSNTVTFADGQKIAYVYLNLSNMELGNSYSCKLNLVGVDATTNPQYGQQITTTNVYVTCDYNWESAGTAQFFDVTWYDEGVATTVPVQHAVGTNIYRLVSPLYYAYTGIEYNPDRSNFQFTLNADNSISIADGLYLNWWGYQMLYDTTYYSNYCYVEQAGNTYKVNFLLQGDAGLYTGGYFEFTWNRTAAFAPVVTSEPKQGGTGHEKKHFEPLFNEQVKMLDESK